MSSDHNSTPSPDEIGSQEMSSASSKGRAALGFVVPLLLGVIAVFLVRHFQQPELKVAVAPVVERPKTVTIPDAPVASSSPTPNAPTHVPPVKFLATNLRQTSWQNPFEPTLWEAADWSVSADGLRSPDIGQSIASFRQPYERATFLFQAETTVPLGLSSTSFDPQEVLFEVRCLDIKSGAVLRTSVKRDRITLTEAINGETRLQRESPLLESTHAGYLRMSFTGQRILIAWNDQFLINAPQSSREAGGMLLQLVTQNRSVLFRDMRIEGE